MTLNVFCLNNNFFFRLGISKIIERSQLSDAEVQFLPVDNFHTLSQADFIIISVSQWRFHMCQPEYRDRKPGSIILVFFDGADEFISRQLPLCYYSLITVLRSDSVRTITEKLINHRLKGSDRLKVFSPDDCARCSFSRMTIVQLQVLGLIKKGLSMAQISCHMKLSTKTIYSHKYNIMKKFSLKGDMELNDFMNDLSLVELYNGVIKDPKR